MNWHHYKYTAGRSFYNPNTRSWCQQIFKSYGNLRVCMTITDLPHPLGKFGDRIRERVACRHAQGQHLRTGAEWEL